MARQATVMLVQRGTISLTPGNTSATATIRSVPVAYSVLNIVGVTTDSTTVGPDTDGAIGTLTNSTTVTVTRVASTTTVIVSYEVITFRPDAVRSIQAVQVTFNGVATGSTTLSRPVNMSKTIIFPNSWSNSTPAAGAGYLLARLQLTDAVTVTGDIGVAAGIELINGTVVEFY